MSDAPDSRRPLKVEVDVQFDGYNGRERHADALLYPKGLLLRTRYLKPVGTAAEFEIFVVEGEAPLRGRGPVVFSRWQDQGARKPAGLGLRVDEWLDESGPRAAQWFEEPAQPELAGASSEEAETPTDLTALPGGGSGSASYDASYGVASARFEETDAPVPARNESGLPRWDYASGDADPTPWTPMPASDGYQPAQSPQSPMGEVAEPLVPFVPVWTPPDGTERPGNSFARENSREFSDAALDNPSADSLIPPTSSSTLAPPPPFSSYGSYGAPPSSREAAPPPLPLGSDVPVGRDGSVVWAPAERRGSWMPWIGGGLALGALLAGGYWLYATQFAASASSPSATSSVATASTPSPTKPPQPEPAAQPPVVVGQPEPPAPTSAAPIAPPAAPAEASPPVPAVESANASPTARFRAVRSIQVDRDEDGIVVSIGLDGRVSKADFERFRLEGPTREVLRLKGVEAPYGQPRIVVGDALLQSVRTGIQPGNALHVVLDLPRAGIRVEAPVIDGTRILLRVRG